MANSKENMHQQQIVLTAPSIDNKLTRSEVARGRNHLHGRQKLPLGELIMVEKLPIKVAEIVLRVDTSCGGHRVQRTVSSLTIRVPML